MRCFHCSGTMTHATAPFSVDRNGYHVSWESVPAWVCDQCGEPFFESREVGLIQHALAALDENTAGFNAGLDGLDGRR